MTYTCQIRVASAMINPVNRAKNKTRPALAQIMINAGEYRSLKTPPAGVRMVPGIDATASTTPSSAPEPVTRSTSHVRATRKAWSASIERPAPAHSRRKERLPKGLHTRSAANCLSAPTPTLRALRTLLFRSTNASPSLIVVLLKRRRVWYRILNRNTTGVEAEGSDAHRAEVRGPLGDVPSSGRAQVERSGDR